MNPFTEIKLALEAQKAMKNLLANGWKHGFTTVAGALLAALEHFTGAHDAKSAVVAILIFALGWIAKNPGLKESK